MIDLKTLEIQTYDYTSNWSCAILYARDPRINKMVKIATKDYATGVIKEFPHATKENAISNLEKLSKYLQDNQIDSGLAWQDKASFKAKQTFNFCFNSAEPNFIAL